MPQRVAILGGGVAGLSAAHELFNRGFEVHVYEASDVVGGKARSLGVPGSGVGGRPDLPGEHGFRFFPGFYKHLPQTMTEIQVGVVSAWHHLVELKETLLARDGGQRHITTPNAFPTTLEDLIQAFQSFTLFYCDLGIPKGEVAHFIKCLVRMLVSGDDRRFGDFEKQNWFDYIGAGGMSKPYKDYLAIGLSRSLVALNAKHLSARTGACILLRFLLDFAGGIPIDRVLDLPTNDAWIDPWQTQLENGGLGVQFHFKHELDSFQVNTSSRRITRVNVKTPAGVVPVTADYYIAAVPVEVMKSKLAPLLAVDPGLSSLNDLHTEWMTGIIFYLNRDVPIVEGHANYLDSDWALTSISQAQFWPTVNLANFGDGTVRGVLSVIISNWNDPLFGGGPKAKDCNEADVIDHVWQQLKDHLNRPGQPPLLSNGDKVAAFIAPCLKYHSTASPPFWENKEQLFINEVDTWRKRPRAVTGIGNLYLASDYVRTYTDLATMESANEAARHAVNGILNHLHSPLPRCETWPPDEPVLLSGARDMDDYLYWLGLPPLVPPIPALPWPCPP